MTTDIQTWIADGAKKKASDFLWISGNGPELKIDGKFYPIIDPSSRPLADEEGRIKEIVAELLSLTIHKPSLDGFLKQVYAVSQDGLGGQGEIIWSLGQLRLRTSVYLTKGRLSVAIRLLPHRILSFEEIFVVRDFIEVIQKLLIRQHGLILVTGPTGTGKTTTLATLIDFMLRSRHGHIITLEDPIEYLFENGRQGDVGRISQREFGSDFPNFAKAITAGLRQAPDVFMVGEVRDPETAYAALHAAETGHLVLATLHTSNAAETVSRWVDLFPENVRDIIRPQFAIGALGIICQRLLPRADGKGRIAAFEILSMSSACRNIIRDNRLMQIATYLTPSHGSIQFDAYLVELIRNRLITQETGIIYANNPNELRQLLTPK